MLYAIAVAIGALLLLSVAIPPAGAVFPGINGKIACLALRGPNPPPAGVSRNEIVDVNPDGSGENLLTNNTIADIDPAYSPDGTKIAFVSTREAGNPEIYVGPASGGLDGANAKRLTYADGTLTNGTKSALAATDASPTWSPDGKQIAFHSGREATFTDGGPSPTAGGGNFDIYKMSSTLGEAVTPATRLTFTRGQDAIPAWSPDGTKIAFQSLRTADATHPVDLEIFTMNPDGSGQTNVSNSPGTPNDPSTPVNENNDGLDRDVYWSPDSSKLAFSSTRATVNKATQNFEVFRMNRDGTSPVQLTLNLSGDTPSTDADYDAPQSWSPDGTKILFNTGRTSTLATSTFDNYTMSSTLGEAGGITKVVSSIPQFGKCDWQALQAAPPGPPAPTPPESAPPATSPPSTTPPSTPDGSDQPPLVVLGGPDVQRLGSLYVSVVSNKDAAVGAGGTITPPRTRAATTYRLRSTSANAPARTTVKLRLKLPAKAARAIKRKLRRGRQATARITVTATDKGGRKRTAQRKIKVVR